MASWQDANLESLQKGFITLGLRTDEKEQISISKTFNTLIEAANEKWNFATGGQIGDDQGYGSGRTKVPDFSYNSISKEDLPTKFRQLLIIYDKLWRGKINIPDNVFYRNVRLLYWMPRSVYEDFDDYIFKGRGGVDPKDYVDWEESVFGHGYQPYKTYYYNVGITDPFEKAIEGDYSDYQAYQAYGYNDPLLDELGYELYTRVFGYGYLPFMEIWRADVIQALQTVFKYCDAYYTDLNILQDSDSSFYQKDFLDRQFQTRFGYGLNFGIGDFDDLIDRVRLNYPYQVENGRNQYFSETQQWRGPISSSTWSSPRFFAQDQVNFAVKQEKLDGQSISPQPKWLFQTDYNTKSLRKGATGGWIYQNQPVLDIFPYSDEGVNWVRRDANAPIKVVGNDNFTTGTDDEGYSTWELSLLTNDNGEYEPAFVHGQPDDEERYGISNMLSRATGVFMYSNNPALNFYIPD